ncbi:uncharacterized protein LOC123554442 [Mercenaria mercenaria]|uniref:uncharacterized protein LOC123554442 n=1 Tax=Mercenaria mercenaria TaxID=6596 RepID=UPI00234EEEC2|nr:uncharacterized protein LOC123554442 [Mercenaria mercenaria]XP_045200529.2 uncharacterized protein LOC123554442 [Mercenaria mercenaria]
MRVLQQTHNIKDADSPKGGQTCFGCLPPIRVFRRDRRLHKEAPDEETRIVILHENIKEEFEATLRTYERRQKDGSRYYRHFLIDILENGPAGLMRIEDYDELLVLDDDEVPDKSHNEVLGLFRNVKVDGQTRFALVIRRKPTRKWIWIETSAILAPGSPPISEGQPVVEKAKFKKSDNKYVEMTTKNRYKIRGTQLFLDIKNQQVTADVASGTVNDSTKIICKHERYWQDCEGQVYFDAALCDESGKNYIGVGSKNEIIVKNEPEWFQMQKTASDIKFKVKEKDLYLGYNRQHDQVDAQPSEFFFEEIPGDVELPKPRSQSPSSDNVSSSRSSASSDDEESPKDKLISALGSCHISASGMHLKRAHEKNDTKSQLICSSFNFSDSVSSGYLSIHLEQMDPLSVDNYAARSLDKLDTIKVYAKRKETTV